MNGFSLTHFEHGAMISNVPNTQYLGISLDENASNQPDLNARVTATLTTIRALNNFWKSSAKPKWKLLVFNVVAGAKFLYGLESLQLTDADFKRLDAFQQRGLRRILGILPSYLDRTATNQFVLETERKETMRRRTKQGKCTQFETF